MATKNEKKTDVGTILGLTVGVSLLSAALSYALPEQYAGTAVGFTFIFATYVFVLHTGDDRKIKHFGLSLGGLFETEPLSLRRMARATKDSAVFCLITMVVTFPPFWLGFLFWYRPDQGFSVPDLKPLADESLGQLLVIALPEEAFYRGYVQTSLQDAWPPERRLLGAKLGAGWLLTSLLFAGGHVLTEPSPHRLAVFFPALVFGWLRVRTGGIGASVAYHAGCNLFASYLARSYGLLA